MQEGGKALVSHKNSKIPFTPSYPDSLMSLLPTKVSLTFQSSIKSCLWNSKTEYEALVKLHTIHRVSFCFFHIIFTHPFPEQNVLVIVWWLCIPPASLTPFSSHSHYCKNGWFQGPSKHCRLLSLIASVPKVNVSSVFLFDLLS